jgi:branched-chain amino acid transport system substrate-binding protein
VISPVTGALAEVGQDCRLGAQMAAEAINATGGIRSQGGARLELLLADSQTKAAVARAEADRLLSSGAQMLTGGFHSAHVAGIAPLAQQRRVPYVVGIRAEDAVTANVAKSLREGQQKAQYVYRVFPGSATFGRNELGDNPNASTAAIQILGGKPRVVWPREAAEVKFVFPTSRFRR